MNNNLQFKLQTPGHCQDQSLVLMPRVSRAQMPRVLDNADVSVDVDRLRTVLVAAVARAKVTAEAGTGPAQCKASLTPLLLPSSSTSRYTLSRENYLKIL